MSTTGRTVCNAVGVSYFRGEGDSHAHNSLVHDDDLDLLDTTNRPETVG